MRAETIVMLIAALGLSGAHASEELIESVTVYGPVRAEPLTDATKGA
jgi:hypothetical protein